MVWEGQEGAGQIESKWLLYILFEKDIVIYSLACLAVGLKLTRRRSKHVSRSYFQWGRPGLVLDLAVVQSKNSRVTFQIVTIERNERKVKPSRQMHLKAHKLFNSLVPVCLRKLETIQSLTTWVGLTQCMTYMHHWLSFPSSFSIPAVGAGRPSDRRTGSTGRFGGVVGPSGGRC